MQAGIDGHQQPQRRIAQVAGIDKTDGDLAALDSAMHGTHIGETHQAGGQELR
jgi:hypothetical protein